MGAAFRGCADASATVFLCSGSRISAGSVQIFFRLKLRQVLRLPVHGRWSDYRRCGCQSELGLCGSTVLCRRYAAGFSGHHRYRIQRCHSAVPDSDDSGYRLFRFAGISHQSGAGAPFRCNYSHFRRIQLFLAPVSL